MKRPPHRVWLAYAATALACTWYLNARAKLVPRWGEWYLPSEGYPYTIMQVRALLSGRLALLLHPGSGNDFIWGRGGMHNAWGLGVAVLATPFHLLGRLFGAPGFPDNVAFLVLYAVTAFVLAGALHRTSRDEPTALFASAAAAGFVMVFPTFVGMVSSRFLIYELTIATASLWSLLELAGVLLLLHRSTTTRLVAVCLAAGFSTMIRPPQAVYGVMTAVLALVIASKRGARRRVLATGLAAYGGSAGLYLVGNLLRFGSPLATGYDNCLSGAFVNRMARWGLGFAKVPLGAALKEQFATLFQLDPAAAAATDTAQLPEPLRHYIVGERWREYYSPTYDLVIFTLWAAALAIVCWRVVAHRLWRADRDLRGEAMTVIGAWAVPPSILLFCFYARTSNMVTRYAVDLYPAFAASSLCAGMAIVEAVRKRRPSMVASAQLALACAAALYVSRWRGWPTHLSQPADRSAVVARLESLDATQAQGLDPASVPARFTCADPRGEPLVHDQLADWLPDCSYTSATVFAMRRTPCVAFTLRAKGEAWGMAEDEALRGLRVRADFDDLVSCGPPRIVNDARRVTMCEPHSPAFVLDGMRLYAFATLDDNLEAIDWLDLMQIDSVPSCP